ncbi:hypothetical protein PR202_ga13735 [Eleusine coracana subsp. coracana]|uniref:LOB domain-containing protein n=1 Tax=Eleusine coracana subsp. coracana TaxID=191504 RepID=A0AAV5CEV0_ELECO|nr:hypothetical protein PR202_ga13735 [Eleusine coracana subsp. coracana]
MSSSMNANTEAGAGNPGRRCAACKNQRRKCSQDCILAPYFPATDPQRYACVQRIFGASNIARVLQALGNDHFSLNETCGMIFALAEQWRVPSLSFLRVQSLPVQERGKAADTMAMEAYRRVQDPVYGCAGVIARLQEEIRAVQSELARTQAQIAVHAAAAGVQPAAELMNAQAVAPPPQQQAGDAMMVQQEPFPGLDELLLDDFRAGDNLFHDDMII